MACCLNQCWLINSEAQLHSYKGNSTRDASNIYHLNPFEIRYHKFHSNFPGANELMLKMIIAEHTKLWRAMSGMESSCGHLSGLWSLTPLTSHLEWPYSTGDGQIMYTSCVVSNSQVVPSFGKTFQCFIQVLNFAVIKQWHGTAHKNTKHRAHTWWWMCILDAEVITKSLVVILYE